MNTQQEGWEATEFNQSTSFHHFEACTSDFRLKVHGVVLTEVSEGRAQKPTVAAGLSLGGLAGDKGGGRRRSGRNPNLELWVGAGQQGPAERAEPPQPPAPRSLTVLGGKERASVTQTEGKARRRTSGPCHKVDGSRRASWVEMPSWRPRALRDHRVQALGRLKFTLAKTLKLGLGGSRGPGPLAVEGLTLATVVGWESQGWIPHSWKPAPS